MKKFAFLLIILVAAGFASCTEDVVEPIQDLDKPTLGPDMNEE